MNEKVTPNQRFFITGVTSTLAFLGFTLVSSSLPAGAKDIPQGNLNLTDVSSLTPLTPTVPPSGGVLIIATRSVMFVLGFGVGVLIAYGILRLEGKGRKLFGNN